MATCHGGMVCVVTVLILWTTDNASTSLYNGSMIWLTATALLLLMLVLPGIAFHPDFANLRMFRRYTRWLQWPTNLIFFIVAADQLLFWPIPIPMNRPLDSESFRAWLVAPQIRGAPLSEPFLNFTAAILMATILVLSTVGLYTDLAHHVRHRRPTEALRSAFQLMSTNLRYRLSRRGKKVWPVARSNWVPSRISGEMDSGALEEFTYSVSFAAVSLAFAMWLPRLALTPPLRQPLSEPGFVPALTYFMAGFGQSRWPAFIILVLFLTGGVDTWLRGIDVAGTRGIAYTLGVWIGSVSLYLLSTSFVLVVIGGIGEIISVSPGWK